MIAHFAGTNSKEYAFKFLDHKEEKRAKGFSRTNQKLHLRFADYSDSVLSNMTRTLKEINLQSKKIKMCACSRARKDSHGKHR